MLLVVTIADLVSQDYSVNVVVWNLSQMGLASGLRYAGPRGGCVWNVCCHTFARVATVTRVRLPTGGDVATGEALG